MNEFRDFVKRHELIKEEVRNNNKTWQNVFEEWSILGEDSFKQYKTSDIDFEEVKKPAAPKATSSTLRNVTKDLSPDTLKNVLGYIKKINPDNLTKTLSSAQKIMAIVQGFIGGSAAGAGIAAANKMTGDPLFDKRFDEWY